MDTSSVVGFGLTIGFLAVFLVVAWAQLWRARKVAAGEISVGNRAHEANPTDPGDEVDPGPGDAEVPPDRGRGS